MKAVTSLKIRSALQLYEMLPDEERIITDVLRQIIREHLPAYCKEKISFNVPYFYGNKGICIIWPSTIYYTIEEINENAIVKLLKEAVKLDASFANTSKKSKAAKFNASK